MNLSKLLTWKGEIDGGSYARWGISLMGLKFLIDALVTTQLFHRTWSPSFYLLPSHGLEELNSGGQIYFLVMLLISLPFLWIGVMLTFRRLRTLDWLPLAFVILFVVPFLNLVFFILLCENTTPRGGRSSHRRERRSRSVAKYVPKSAIPATILALALWFILAIPLTILAVSMLEFYGWSLFVLVPFGLGFITAVVSDYHRRRSLSTTLFTTMLCLTLTGLFIFFIGIEGAVCLIVVAPIAVPTALLGVLLGRAVMAGKQRPVRSAGTFAPVLVLLMPGMMGLESEAAPDPALRKVVTEIFIDATRSEVWKNVVSFSELPEPEDWVFGIGIAYPIRADIRGKGVGAVRHCIFSTGSFVEPIEVWDEPELLRFSVTKSPPTMREWSPWPDLEPAHLEESFAAEQGEFRLEELANGSTRLIGTTWYRQDLRPAFYWHLWTDEIIHRIHLRVLRHIKRLCET